MGILDKIFSSKKVIEDVTESVIKSGDALIYTKEEKEAGRGDLRERLLKLYEPFKLIQRYLAIYYSWIFGFTFVTTFILSIFVGFGKVPKEVLDNVISVATAFNIGLICLAIVGFYFGGGAIEGVVTARAQSQPKDMQKLTKEINN